MASIRATTKKERVQTLIDLIENKTNPLSFSLNPAQHRAIFDEVDAYADVFTYPSTTDYPPIAYSFSTRVTDKMLRHGVDINQLTDNGYTALSRLLDAGMGTSVELACYRSLMKHSYRGSTRPDIRLRLGYEEETLLFYIYNKEVYDIFITPFFEHDEKEKVEFINLTNHEGYTALHHIIYDMFDKNHEKKEKLERIKQIILQHELKDVIHDDRKSNQLLSAYEKRFHEFASIPVTPTSYIDFLCKEGLHINQANDDGNTVLHILFRWLYRVFETRIKQEHDLIASLFQVRDIILILVENGGDLFSIKSNDGKTCIDYLLEAHKDSMIYRTAKQTLPPKHVYHKHSSEYLTALFSIIDELYETLYYHCQVCRSTEKLKKCSGCERVFYCSPEHQKEDWKAHKAFCKAHPIKAAASSKKRMGGTRRTRRARKIQRVRKTRRRSTH